MINLLRPLLVCALLVAVLVLGVTAPVAAINRAVFPAQSLGNSGIDVVALQHLLRARGHGLAVSAVFDTPTQSAVADFQEDQGLTVTGVADSATWEQLVPQLGDGSTGEAVAAVQKLLNRKRGTGLTVNASFDANTRKAVTSFQAHMGLSATGVVNTATWRNLVWHFVRPNFALPGLCNYNGGSAGADWGTGSTAGTLERAGGLFRQRVASRIAIGDISWEHGGDIVLHATHEVGLDADIALVRKDRFQCSNPGIGYRSVQYDRAATRELIHAIYDAAPHQVKLIYFNDPVLVNEGLVRAYPNHNHHLHVRYCEVGHARTRYRCPAPSLAVAASTPAETAADESPLPVRGSGRGVERR